MIQPNDIQAWLKQGLPDAIITVNGDGHHFETVVIWQGFAGKKTLERHRLIYQILGDKMGREIHALSINAKTPDE